MEPELIKSDRTFVHSGQLLKSQKRFLFFCVLNYFWKESCTFATTCIETVIFGTVSVLIPKELLTKIKLHETLYYCGADHSSVLVFLMGRTLLELMNKVPSSTRWLLKETLKDSSSRKNAL